MENGTSNRALSDVSLANRATTAILVTLILLSLLIFSVGYLSVSSWDFRNNLWGPANLLVNGYSPYRIDILFERGQAIWFPMAIGALFPLGWLSLQTATNLWFVANLALGLALALISAEAKRPSPPKLAMALLTIFLFPPIITHLRLGQISLLTTFLLLIAGRFAHRLSPLFTTVLLALALAKPQLGLLVVPGLLVWSWKNQGVLSALSLAGLLLAAAAFLSLPLTFAAPWWPADFLDTLRQNPGWLQPSLLTPLRLRLGATGILLWLLIVAILVVGNALAWLRYEPENVIYWSLAATPLVAPYVWSWDFVMLLPLITHSIFKLKSRLALTLLVSGYALGWLLIVRQAYSAPKVSNHLYWWIPWYFVLLTTCTWLIEHHRRPGRPPIIA